MCLWSPIKLKPRNRIAGIVFSQHFNYKRTGKISRMSVMKSRKSSHGIRMESNKKQEREIMCGCFGYTRLINLDIVNL